MAAEAFLNAVTPANGLEQPHGTGGGQDSTQGEAFAQLLAQPPAAAPDAALDVVMRTSMLRPGGAPGLGEDVSAGLRRFGETMNRMEQMGTYKPSGSRAGQGSARTAASQPSVLPGPAEKGLVPGGGTRTAEDYIAKAEEMAQDAMARQSQLYKVVMDFTLVHSSAESLNKSLKTLLTQGGG